MMTTATVVPVPVRLYAFRRLVNIAHPKVHGGIEAKLEKFILPPASVHEFYQH